MVKHVFIFVITLSLIFAVGAYAAWSDQIQIAPGNAPDIAIDRTTGYAHILSIGSAGLIYTLCDPAGNIVSQESVPGASGEMGGLNFEP